jgi:hypothetical protein
MQELCLPVVRIFELWDLCSALLFNLSLTANPGFRKDKPYRLPVLGAAALICENAYRGLLR